MIENAEKSIRDICDMNEMVECITGIPERGEGRIEGIFGRMMAKNFPKQTKTSNYRFNNNYEP